MSKKISMMIPAAVEAVKNHLLDKEKGKVNDAYDGYIASFGTSILQSGLLVATAMFSDETKKDKTKGEKGRLMDAVLEVLKSTNPEFEAFQSLFALVYEHQKNKLVRKNILDASVAIKLSLRTFEQFDPQKNEANA